MSFMWQEQTNSKVLVDFLTWTDIFRQHKTLNWSIFSGAREYFIRKNKTTTIVYKILHICFTSYIGCGAALAARKQEVNT